MDQFEDNRDYYETGSTKPPKNYSALIAVLIIMLVTCIAGYAAVARLHPGEKEDAEAPTLSAHAVEPENTGGTAPSAAISGQTETQRYEMPLEKSPLSVENIPQAEGLSLQQIYVKAINSVVSISSTGPNVSATGSGVVVSADGYIVTNCHVVEGGTEFSVLLTDTRLLSATMVGMDTVSDLAVLQVDADDLVPAEFGDSSVLRVGDTVVAIGDPLGIDLRGTMTDGIVSAINRDITTEGRTMTLIQTNAALNAGNSGGPLLNCYGQVIGINTMKISRSLGSAAVEGLGFAIPSTTVKQIVDQLISQGYVSGRPALGFTCETVDAFYQLYYHLPAGVCVVEIPDQSFAAQAGMRQGDLVVYFDGERVRSVEELRTLLNGHQAGDSVPLVLYRAGEQIHVNLTLGQAAG